MISIDLHQLSSVILRQVRERDTIDGQRVAAAVHYVIAKAAPGKLGHVKLNKILWCADLEHYRCGSVTITGLQHSARTLYGPMSQDIVGAVGRLASEGKVEERTVTVTDYTRREMICLQDPDISEFTGAQIDILDQMINAIVPLSASQLSRMNRDDPLWNELENNEDMSVATGSIMTPPPAQK